MEIVTNIDSKMLKEFNRRILWMGIAYLIAGVVVIPIYIIFSSYWFYDLNKILFFMFCLFALGGIFSIALYFVSIKNARYKNRSVSCKFYLDYMEYSMLYHGEVEASRKLYYQDIYKVRETKN